MRHTGQHRSSGQSPEKASLYQEVTDKIIAELEQGRVPWVQPWGGAKAGLGLPKNAATGRRYSGRKAHALSENMTASSRSGSAARSLSGTASSCRTGPAS